jgi:3-phenylpropionate/cinnamic acid dioxygenase small subunit
MSEQQWRDAQHDELGVRRTLEHYMRYNDDKRLDQILPLFASDAIYRVAGRTMVGHEAISAFFEELGYRNGRPRWTDEGHLLDMPRSAHLMSNPVIEVAGDTATAESDFAVMDRDETGHATVILAGRYRDRLRRQGESWVFVERTGVSMARRNAPADAQEPAPAAPPQ